MVYDIDNKDLRLLLRALIAYEKCGGEDARLDKEDIKNQKETIMILLKAKRLRSNSNTRT